MKQIFFPRLMSWVCVVFVAGVLAGVVSPAFGEIVERDVVYSHDGVELRGLLVFDDEMVDQTHPAPGVLVVHEWWGRNEHARERAIMLAQHGFVAFALDMYGVEAVDGMLEARDLATPFYGDRGLMRARAGAGLDAMRAQPEVDVGRMAAIGYCFGGTVVLELARGGADLKAVVSFHGGLSAPEPMKAEAFGGTVLVCNGAADPLVPMEERNAFVAEMELAGTDYLFIEYAGALHSFTSKRADAVAERAGLQTTLGYDPRADRRSWRHMLDVFDTAFARPMTRGEGHGHDHENGHGGMDGDAME